MNSQTIERLIKSNYHCIFLSGKVNIGKSDLRGGYHIGLKHTGLCGMPFGDQFDCGIMGEEHNCLAQTLDTETVRYRRLQSDHPIFDYRFCLECLIIMMNVVCHDRYPDGSGLKVCPYDGKVLRYWADKTHMICEDCGIVEPRNARDY
jgi:hypothetical protein